MEFYTRYKHRFSAGELRGELRSETKSLVDVKGYIPMHKQIQHLLANGDRLEQYRKLMNLGFDVDYTHQDYDDDPSPIYSDDFLPSSDYRIVADNFQQRIAEYNKRLAIAKANESVAKKEPDANADATGGNGGTPPIKSDKQDA